MDISKVNLMNFQGPIEAIKPYGYGLSPQKSQVKNPFSEKQEISQIGYCKNDMRPNAQTLGLGGAPSGDEVCGRHLFTYA